MGVDKKKKRPRGKRGGGEGGRMVGHHHHPEIFVVIGLAGKEKGRVGKGKKKEQSAEPCDFFFSAIGGGEGGGGHWRKRKGKGGTRGGLESFSPQLDHFQKEKKGGGGFEGKKGEKEEQDGICAYFTSFLLEGERAPKGKSSEEEKKNETVSFASSSNEVPFPGV